MNGGNARTRTRGLCCDRADAIQSGRGLDCSTDADNLLVAIVFAGGGCSVFAGLSTHISRDTDAVQRESRGRRILRSLETRDAVVVVRGHWVRLCEQSGGNATSSSSSDGDGLNVPIVSRFKQGVMVIERDAQAG